MLAQNVSRRVLQRWTHLPLKGAITPQLRGLSTTAGMGYRDMSSTSQAAMDSMGAPVDMSMAKKALIHDMSQRQMENSAQVVPWFLDNMPNSYFRQVNDELRSQHLTVVSAIRELNQSGLTIKIDRKNPDGSFDYSFLTSGDIDGESIGATGATGALYRQVSEVDAPEGFQLRRVKVFSSMDKEIDINVFSFEDPAKVQAAPNKDDTAKIQEYIDSTLKGSADFDESLYGKEAMSEYFKKCTAHYCSHSSPRRFLNQRKMFEQVKGTDRTIVDVEKRESTGDTWITIVSGNILPKQLLQVSAKLIAEKDLSIGRSHLDTVRDDLLHPSDSYGCVTMLRVKIDDHPLLQDAAAMDELASSLRRAKWLDDEVIDLGLNREEHHFGLQKAEIITAMATVLHGRLAKKNPQAFASVKTINDLLFESPHFIHIAEEITDLFVDRFTPPRLGGPKVTEAEYQSKLESIQSKVTGIHYETARELLTGMVDVVRYTLKTNLFHDDRYSLALRLDPRLMVSEDSGDAMPFGVIFAAGRNFAMIHNRFRDVARGGLRVVTPPNSGQHALESSSVYEEVYGLSWAQQLKNKDIPEGGSKAVCLVNTPNMRAEDRYLECRKAVRAAADAILDLTVKESVTDLVDRYGKEEQIFLGPDEQVVPTDCDWICQRAGERGYPTPMAFMSSKPVAGFNHKQYGVTSEGVVVNLVTALKYSLGIDAKKDKFSVKITGGPDGDVGGNLLKILHRDYRNTATVLGVADGMGVAEDPAGLDLDELVRLFNASLPITHFDPKKLSKDGLVLDAATEEGMARRNTMAFRIKSDAFVPAGGRPKTINSSNWKQFLLEDGTPSSPLIVEGANIFTTPEARTALFENAKVAIVKDSSANKCGVITSSQEVACSMLLTTEEFLEHKEELAKGMINHLHDVAGMEANLLFKEYTYHPGALPHFSERISNAINFVTDCIADRLQDVEKDDELFQLLLPLVKKNLPAKLVELAWDRVGDLPTNYLRNAIASTLASRMVYHEGIHAIESQPADEMANRAFEYYKKTEEINRLMLELAEAQETGVLSEESQNKVIGLLKKGGARSSCEFF